MKLHISPILFFIVAEVLFSLAYWLIEFRSHMRKKKSKIKFYLFFAYLILIASVTLFPITSPPVGAIPNFKKNLFNIVPFKSIILLVTSTPINVPIIFLSTVIKNIVGNIFLFIPLGFLISSISKISHKKIELYCVFIPTIISVAVEFIQFLETYFNLNLNRDTNIDDVIMNVFGLLIGLLLYQLYCHWKSMRIYKRL